MAYIVLSTIFFLISAIAFAGFSPLGHVFAKTCPKGLNPAKAIAEIKKKMVERTI